MMHAMYIPGLRSLDMMFLLLTSEIPVWPQCQLMYINMDTGLRYERYHANPYRECTPVSCSCEDVRFAPKHSNTTTHPHEKKQNKPKVINCMTKQIFSLNIYIPSRISTSEKLFNAKTIVNHWGSICKKEYME